MTRVGRPPRIGIDHIVAAAGELAAEQGIGAVTMTAVADRLGVVMPALYHHVAGKDELLGLLGTSLFDTVVVPEPGDVPWTDWLVDLAGSLRQAAKRQPSLVIVPPLAAHGLVTPAVVEAALHVLVDAGFELHEAVDATEQLVATVMGQVYREHCIVSEAARGRSQLAAFREALRDVERSEAPLLFQLADGWAEVPASATPDLDEAFDRMVRVVVAGLAAQHASHGRALASASLDSPPPLGHRPAGVQMTSG